MKKIGVMVFLFIVLSIFLGSQEPVLNLGKIHFPSPFIHARKDYPGGIYRVFLTTGGDAPYFKVFNRKNEFLFDELAIVQPYGGRSKNFKPRIRRTVLSGREYFRLKIITPEKVYLAFFLLQKGEEKKQEKTSETEVGRPVG